MLPVLIINQHLMLTVFTILCQRYINKAVLHTSEGPGFTVYLKHEIPSLFPDFLGQCKRWECYNAL